MSSRVDGTRGLWLLFAMVGLAAILRGLGLGREGLWVDEAYTAEIIRGSWSEILQRLRADEAPPLFYFLQKGVSVFGTSEGVLRLLPCLAGIATVAVATRLALSSAASGGLRRPLFVGLTFATSTLLVFYSQQARSYSWVHLLELTLLASTLVLCRGPSRDSSHKSGPETGPKSTGASERDSGRALTWFWPVLWIVSALGLLYSHNLAVWPVLAAVLFWIPRLRLNLRRNVTVLTLTLLGALPWAVSLWHQVGMHRDLNTWMGEWWTDRILALGPLYSVGVFTNGIAPYFRPPIPLPGITSPTAGDSALLQLATLVGIGTVWVGLVFALRVQGRTRELVGGAILFAVLPLLGLLATSWFLGPAYVVGRTDTFALPGFLLWIALGWTVAPRRLGILCLVSWVTLGLLTLLGPGHAEKGSDRQLAEFLAERAAPAEPVFVSLLGQPSLRYYGRKLGFADEGRAVRGFPRVAEVNPAAVFELPTDSLAVYLREARQIRESVQNLDLKAVWVTSRLHEPPPNWPRRPSPPPLERTRRNANDLPYPTSLLVYTFVGLDSVEVAAEYRQDWITGSRVLLRIPRTDWVDYDDLPPIEEPG